MIPLFILAKRSLEGIAQSAVEKFAGIKARKEMFLTAKNAVMDGAKLNSI